MSRLSRQYGIHNILQPYRPPKPFTGIALLYFLLPSHLCLGLPGGISFQYPRCIKLIFHACNMPCSSYVPHVCWKWYRNGVINVTMLKWYTPKDDLDMQPMTTGRHKLRRPGTEISFGLCLLYARPISDSYSLLKINYNWCNDYTMLWHTFKDYLGIKYKTIRHHNHRGAVQNYHCVSTTRKSIYFLLWCIHCV
jgi:hypothetical protein